MDDAIVQDVNQDPTSDTPLSRRDAILVSRAFGHMPYMGPGLRGLRPEDIRTMGDVLNLLRRLADRLREHAEGQNARDAEVMEIRAFRGMVRKILAPHAEELGITEQQS